MSNVTVEKKIIKFEAISNRVRKQLEEQVAKQNKITSYRRVRFEEVRTTSREFDRIYSAFCGGEISNAEELLRRIENKQGINVYDYVTVLYIIDVLLKDRFVDDYSLVIKEHLQYLLEKMKNNILANYDYGSIIVTIDALLNHKLSEQYYGVIEGYLNHLLYRIEHNKSKKYDKPMVLTKIINMLLQCNNSNKYINYTKSYLDYLYVRIENDLDKRYNLGMLFDLLANILSSSNVAEYTDIEKKYLVYLFEQLKQRSRMEYPYKKVTKVLKYILCYDELSIFIESVKYNLKIIIDNINVKDSQQLNRELVCVIELAEKKGITINSYKIKDIQDAVSNSYKSSYNTKIEYNSSKIYKQPNSLPNNKGNNVHTVSSESLSTMELIICLIGIILVLWIGWTVIGYIWDIILIIIDILL